MLAQGLPHPLREPRGGPWGHGPVRACPGRSRVLSISSAYTERWGRLQRLRALSVHAPTVNRCSMGDLYGHAGRLTTKNGGSRPGWQRPEPDARLRQDREEGERLRDGGGLGEPGDKSNHEVFSDTIEPRCSLLKTL